MGRSVRPRGQRNLETLVVVLMQTGNRHITSTIGSDCRPNPKKSKPGDGRHQKHWPQYDLWHRRYRPHSREPAFRPRLLLAPPIQSVFRSRALRRLTHPLEVPQASAPCSFRFRPPLDQTVAEIAVTPGHSFFSPPVAAIPYIATMDGATLQLPVLLSLALTDDSGPVSVKFFSQTQTLPNSNFPIKAPRTHIRGTIPPHHPSVRQPQMNTRDL